MRRNPLAVVAAALRSLVGSKPKKRTVQLASPAADVAPEPRQRKHSKHGRTSLVWRQKNHARRRALLAGTFTRVFSHSDHPLVAMAKKAPPEIRADKARARRWARNRLKKLRRAA
jgi:hypothetical protein